MSVSGISANISENFLGLGELFSQIGGTGAEGTSVCGSRPTCIGNGRSCQQKQATYESCLLASIDSTKQVGIANAQAQARGAQSPTTSNNKMLYIGVAVVGVILLIAFIRR